MKEVLFTARKPNEFLMAYQVWCTPSEAKRKRPIWEQAGYTVTITSLEESR